MKLAKISTLETEELACHITGLDYDEIDADEEIIDEKLQEEFGCDLQQFTHIIQRLLPMIDVGSSPLTQKRYKGFSDTEKGMWFVKIDAEIPIAILYGSLDHLVIGKRVHQLARMKPQTTIKKVRAPHGITQNYSQNISKLLFSSSTTQPI